MKGPKIGDMTADIREFGSGMLGPFPRPFVAALGANCPFIGFLDPLGAYVRGAGVAFCEDNGVLGHVLAKLQEAVDDGEGAGEGQNGGQDLKRARPALQDAGGAEKVMDLSSQDLIG